MPTDSLIIILLLAVVLLLVAYAMFIRPRTSANEESSEVLKERISARESELSSLVAALEEKSQQLGAEQEKSSSLREQLSRQETLLQQERKHFEEKLALLNSAREQMKLEFSQLANEILEQKGKVFVASNKENMQHILGPLNEKIQSFQKKVEETYDREAKERFSLKKEIVNLQELNSRISEEALNLTKALKGESKTQGTWGEVILERVLERSGLKKGGEYEIQVNVKSSEGRNLQPDVVVHLPEGKDVIIDAKVSLVAYERYCSEEDEDARKGFLKQHIQSIRTHIKGLSKKDYHNLDSLKSLDFVMMFLPVEAAFTLAVQEDTSLFTEAFDQNIMLVGPSNLLATLRTIQNIWRYEYQNKNALEIAKRAGALYDKFVSFTDDLGEIGHRLEQTHVAYDNAHKKLSSGRGNLVSHVEKLKVLGARASKQLDEKLLDDNADPLSDSDNDNESGSENE